MCNIFNAHNCAPKNKDAPNLFRCYPLRYLRNPGMAELGGVGDFFTSSWWWPYFHTIIIIEFLY